MTLGKVVNNLSRELGGTGVIEPCALCGSYFNRLRISLAAFFESMIMSLK